MQKSTNRLTRTSVKHWCGGLALLAIACAAPNPALQDLGGDMRQPGGPSVTAVTPSLGSSAGGLLVTVDGSGFTSDTSVLFGTQAGTQVTVLSPTQLTVLTPANPGKVGAVDVILTTTERSTALPGGFSYYLGSVSFPAPSGTDTPPSPRSVVISDLDKDGKADLVSANADVGTATHSVSVLLGNGNGSFKPLTSYTVGTANGSYPFMAAVGDIDGDGKLDIATPNQGSNDVSVLLGNGNGTFKSADTFSGMGAGVGKKPQGLVIVDVDGDGKNDLVTANFGSDDLSVLLNKGYPSFTAVRITVDASPYFLASADLNKDGKPDLAVAHSTATNNVSVLLGKGDGTFDAPAVYSAAAGVFSLAVADVNGDGFLDLASGNALGNNVSLLLGSATGKLTVSSTTLNVGMRPEYLLAADGNGDSGGGGGATLSAAV